MLVVNDHNQAAEGDALRSMFEARKAVFIDLLKWELPVLAGRYEVDQFDDVHATYLILSDLDRRHLASARLLPTERPGILSSLFPGLCDRPPPAGPEVFEITRFCLSRTLRAPERRRARDRLVTGLAWYALNRGISTFTGIAELGWLRQILTFGWECRQLGAAQCIDGRMLGALAIEIDAETPARLVAAGIVAEPTMLASSPFGSDR